MGGTTVGASWLTTAFGVGAIVVALAQLVAQIVEENGMPHDLSTWLGFATKFIVGAGLIMTKSFNVTNSPPNVSVAARPVEEPTKNA